jgi:hypothetical protein
VAKPTPLFIRRISDLDVPGRRNFQDLHWLVDPKVIRELVPGIRVRASGIVALNADGPVFEEHTEETRGAGSSVQPYPPRCVIRGRKGHRKRPCRLFEANEEEGVVRMSGAVDGEVAREAARDGECHVWELSSDLEVCMGLMNPGQLFCFYWIDLRSTRLERSHTFLPCWAIRASRFVGVILRPGTGERLILGDGEDGVGEEYKGAGGQASTAQHGEDDATGYRGRRGGIVNARCGWTSDVMKGQTL